MLPTFLVIGAMKCGTTTLHEYFQAHPDITVPVTKETDYFSTDAAWERGPSWYHAQFGPVDAAACGECCPSYAMADRYPETSRRVAETIPGVKLIYMVREPVSRIISMWKHHVYRGEERRSIIDAIGMDSRYLSASRYGWHLSLYRRYFDNDQIRVFSLHELARDPHWVLREIAQFIEVPALAEFPTGVHAHRSMDKRQPRRASSGDHEFVDNPLLGLDVLPQWGQRVLGRRFPADHDLLPVAVADDLRSRLADEMSVLREFVGAARFDGWSWYDGDATA
jgi:hypothetical protein